MGSHARTDGRTGPALIHQPPGVQVLSAPSLADLAQRHGVPPEDPVDDVVLAVSGGEAVGSLVAGEEVLDQMAAAWDDGADVPSA